MPLLKKLEKIFSDAKRQAMWGEVTITFKDGYPILIKTTTQEKAEDIPARDNKTYQ
jgi:hypothetical protein